MQFDVLTLFPEMFEPLNKSIIGRAKEKGLININLINIRDFSKNKHKKVDDTPYGGGAGMVMQAEPILRAVEKAKSNSPKAKVVLLAASGQKFTQQKAQELSQESGLIFICGRYEGIDQRAIDLCVDYEFSLGDFVLMGGEVAAMAVIEATSRLRSGVLGNEASTVHESFSLQDGQNLLLEAPQYTKPAQVRGLDVPDVLLSGNHIAIEKWRLEQSRSRTAKVRPDLLATKA